MKQVTWANVPSIQLQLQYNRVVSHKEGDEQNRPVDMALNFNIKNANRQKFGCMIRNLKKIRSSLMLASLFV